MLRQNEEDDKQWLNDLNGYEAPSSARSSASQSYSNSPRGRGFTPRSSASPRHGSAGISSEPRTPRQGSLRKKKPPVFTEADLEENAPGGAAAEAPAAV